MLFSADFYPTQEEAIAQLGQYFQSPEEDDVDESGILQVLHKVELKEADSEYLQARTANIMEKIPEIDEKLNQAAAGWKTKRMGKVELTILRLALYEMLHDDAIPEKVSINEAVELAKKFGGNDSPSFVNGILAKFVVKGARAAALRLVKVAVIIIAVSGHRKTLLNPARFGMGITHSWYTLIIKFLSQSCKHF